MTDLSEYVNANPKFWNGEPKLADRRLLIEDIYLMSEIYTITQVAHDFTITPAQVCAALLYYYEHQEEIAANLKKKRDEADAFFKTYDTDNDGIVSSDDVRKGSTF